VALFGIGTRPDHDRGEQGYSRGGGPLGFGEALDEPAGLVA
jgi:hypothetical protein